MFHEFMSLHNQNTWIKVYAEEESDSQLYMLFSYIVFELSVLIKLQVATRFMNLCFSGYKIPSYNKRADNTQAYLGQKKL